MPKLQSNSAANLYSLKACFGLGTSVFLCIGFFSSAFFFIMQDYFSIKPCETEMLDIEGNVQTLSGEPIEDVKLVIFSVYFPDPDPNIILEPKCIGFDPIENIDLLTDAEGNFYYPELDYHLVDEVVLLAYKDECQLFRLNGSPRTFEDALVIELVCDELE